LTLPFTLDLEPWKVAVENISSDGRDGRLAADGLILETIPNRVGQVNPPLVRLLDRSDRPTLPGLRWALLPLALVNRLGAFLVALVERSRLRCRPDQCRW
jgi:hypothetical protein